MTKRYYIAGPMTGQPEWGFPAFDEAAKQLKAKGHEVVNPADFARARGFDPKAAMEFSNEELREAMVAEFAGCKRLDRKLPGWCLDDSTWRGLADCTDLVLLPGWESSKGAFAEAAVGFWLGLSVWEQTQEGPRFGVSDLDRLLARRVELILTSILDGDLGPNATPTQNILDEAQEVLADRGRDYGDFSETLQRVARVWEELVGEDEWESRSFRGTIAARFMGALKLVRERQGYKHDNWVDLLNYAVGGDEVGAKEAQA